MNLLDANESNLLPADQPPGGGEAVAGRLRQVAAGTVVVDRRLRGAAAADGRVVGLHAAGASLVNAGKHSMSAPLCVINTSGGNAP